MHSKVKAEIMITEEQSFIYSRVLLLLTLYKLGLRIWKNLMTRYTTQSRQFNMINLTQNSTLCLQIKAQFVTETWQCFEFLFLWKYWPPLLALKHLNIELDDMSKNYQHYFCHIDQFQFDLFYVLIADQWQHYVKPMSNTPIWFI